MPPFELHHSILFSIMEFPVRKKTKRWGQQWRHRWRQFVLRLQWRKADNKKKLCSAGSRTQRLLRRSVLTLTVKKLKLIVFFTVWIAAAAICCNLKNITSIKTVLLLLLLQTKWKRKANMKLDLLLDVQTQRLRCRCCWWWQNTLEPFCVGSKPLISY